MRSRVLQRVLVGLGIVAAGVVLGFAGRAWRASQIPGTYNAMDYGRVEFGGGRPVPHGGPISVARLQEPRRQRPDAQFRLVARKADVQLASGNVVHALTFDGRSPGPELRVHEGDLVEVTLENEDVEGGVTIHWHGLDVPNAEDGVAGVTQDAVAPGHRYTYRFRATRAGTYWYHSHQVSDSEVRRGLFGAFVVLPRDPLPPGTLDLATIAHEFDGTLTLGASDRVERRAVAPGTPVRLRLVNSVERPMTFRIGPTSFRVLAIDGVDLNGPTPLRDTKLVLTGGGRYDVGFTMPDEPVALELAGSDAALALSPDGRADPPKLETDEEFDPAHYGRPARMPFDAASRFDRTFTMRIGKKLGFMDGRFGFHWSLNGGVYPHVPMFVVERGDLVKVEISNKTSSVHPMHLQAITRSCSPAMGSPRRAARGGSTRSTSTPGSATRSASGPTTRASGWITATTCGTRPPV